MGWRWLFVLSAGLCAVGCASLPRDPAETLEHVRGGRMRVGLVESPPWVIRTAGEPAGAEVELVRRAAKELGATPEWVWGGAEQHMEALERFELDLVVGGLTKDTPWKKRVGLTGAYFEDSLRVGVPASNPAAEVRGLHVRVKIGDVAAAYVKKKDGVPVEVPEVRDASEPAALPDWRLEQLGLRPVGDELQSRKHVWAVPPGENGWIRWLEEFFDRQRAEVKGLLQKEAARP